MRTSRRYLLVAFALPPAITAVAAALWLVAVYLFGNKSTCNVEISSALQQHQELHVICPTMNPIHLLLAFPDAHMVTEYPRDLGEKLFHEKVLGTPDSNACLVRITASGGVVYERTVIARSACCCNWLHRDYEGYVLAWNIGEQMKSAQEYVITVDLLFPVPAHTSLWLSGHCSGIEARRLGLR